MAGVSSKCKAQVGVCRGESADWRRQERGDKGYGQESPATGKAWGPLGQQHPVIRYLWLSSM